MICCSINGTVYTSRWIDPIFARSPRPPLSLFSLFPRVPSLSPSLLPPPPSLYPHVPPSVPLWTSNTISSLIAATSLLAATRDRLRYFLRKVLSESQPGLRGSIGRINRPIDTKHCGQDDATACESSAALGRSPIPSRGRQNDEQTPDTIPIRGSRGAAECLSLFLLSRLSLDHGPLALRRYEDFRCTVAGRILPRGLTYLAASLVSDWRLKDRFCWRRSELMGEVTRIRRITKLAASIYQTQDCASCSLITLGTKKFPIIFLK